MYIITNSTQTRFRSAHHAAVLNSRQNQSLIKCRRASMVCFRIVIMYIIHINVVCMYEYLHGDDSVSCRL